jgi:hypothetical protein
VRLYVACRQRPRSRFREGSKLGFSYRKTAPVGPIASKVFVSQKPLGQWGTPRHPRSMLVREILRKMAASAARGRSPDPERSEGRTVANLQTGAKAPSPSAIRKFAHRPVTRRSIQERMQLLGSRPALCAPAEAGRQAGLVRRRRRPCGRTFGRSGAAKRPHFKFLAWLPRSGLRGRRGREFYYPL